MQKPIIYAEIPEFNQCSQAIYQLEPVETEDHVYIGVEVVDLPEEREGEEGEGCEM